MPGASWLPQQSIAGGATNGVKDGFNDPRSQRQISELPLTPVAIDERPQRTSGYGLAADFGNVSRGSDVPPPPLIGSTKTRGLTNLRSRRHFLTALRTASVPGLLSIVVLATAALPTETAHADDEPAKMAMHLRLENDVLSGSDRGYTNGIQVGFTSPTVESFGDAALPQRLRALNRGLAWLQPRGFPENNVTLSIAQGMFTPDDKELSTPDPLDRPYTGMLIGGIVYNGRDAYSMRSTRLDVGLVGPSSLAEQTQDLVHDALGVDEFQGWDHQLNDEPVFRIIHQRMRKWDLKAPRRVDAIVHYGGGIGNMATFANAGAELRFGRLLPDDFGTVPAPQGGELTAPARPIGGDRLPSAHGFIAFDARYVLQDITLDGNTWRDSASVEREPFVADVAVGFAAYWRLWKITVARYFRTREFETERSDTDFGSITFRRELPRH